MHALEMKRATEQYNVTTYIAVTQALVLAP